MFLNKDKTKISYQFLFQILIIFIFDNYLVLDETNATTEENNT